MPCGTRGPTGAGSPQPTAVKNWPPLPLSHSLIHPDIQPIMKINRIDSVSDKKALELLSMYYKHPPRAWQQRKADPSGLNP